MTLPEHDIADGDYEGEDDNDGDGYNGVQIIDVWNSIFFIL